MQHAGNSMKVSGSQGQQPTVLSPTVRNLLHQQGLSALQREAQRLSAREQISLSCCSTSSVLTRDFIVLSRKRITPDSCCLQACENVCAWTGASQKRCCQWNALFMSTCVFLLRIEVVISYTHITGLSVQFRCFHPGPVLLS